MMAKSDAEPMVLRQNRSERFLATLAPYDRVVLVSHVNPDPDSLASMLGLRTLLEARQPAKTVVMTVDGMIARAENRAMVDLMPIPLTPIDQMVLTPEDAVVMVDSQPGTGRPRSESAVKPVAVLDHHETGGNAGRVSSFTDIRANLGATSTMVTGYLLEQDIGASTDRLATALIYGIDSEVSGYPRESGPLDDGALVWLYPSG